MPIGPISGVPIILANRYIVHIMFKQGTSATVQIDVLDSILPGWVNVTHYYEKDVHMKSCEII